MRRRSKPPVPGPIWVHEPILTADRKLWRAVLEQAYVDAEIVSNADGSETLECAQAQSFLRGDTPFEAASLTLVCDFAELPADRVIRWAQQRYAFAA